jgi:hypothetical protein
MERRKPSMCTPQPGKALMSIFLLYFFSELNEHMPEPFLAGLGKHPI